MANHLTPDELSKELGIDRQEVIRVCIEEGVPIYQGKIDKTLFQAQLRRSAPCSSRTRRATTSSYLRAAARFLADGRAAAFFAGLSLAPASSAFASSTLRRSASIRSITGVSSASGSGSASSSPASFASSIARRLLRYSLWSSAARSRP